MMIIKEAVTSWDLQQVRSLLLAYEADLNIDLGFQNFAQEVEMLPGPYTHPHGTILIAIDKGVGVGCVAMKRLSSGICEMKRLYVAPSARGRGWGNKLALEIITVAKEYGYETIRLDTMDSFMEAIALYKSLGFKQIPPYYRNPLPGAVYWELSLINPDE